MSTRAQNREIREILCKYTSVQLNLFFKGFDDKMLRRLQRAINRAKSDSKAEEIRRTEEQIAKLTDHLSELRDG